jgi:hypothetical protein
MKPFLRTLILIAHDIADLDHEALAQKLETAVDAFADANGIDHSDYYPHSEG